MHKNERNVLNSTAVKKHIFPWPHCGPTSCAGALSGKLWRYCPRPSTSFHRMMTTSRRRPRTFSRMLMMILHSQVFRYQAYTCFITVVFRSSKPTSRSSCWPPVPRPVPEWGGGVLLGGPREEREQAGVLQQSLRPVRWAGLLEESSL